MRKLSLTRGLTENQDAEVCNFAHFLEIVDPPADDESAYAYEVRLWEEAALQVL